MAVKPKATRKAVPKLQLPSAAVLLEDEREEAFSNLQKRSQSTMDATYKLMHKELILAHEKMDETLAAFRRAGRLALLAAGTTDNNAAHLAISNMTGSLTITYYKARSFFGALGVNSQPSEADGHECVNGIGSFNPHF